MSFLPIQEFAVAMDKVGFYAVLAEQFQEIHAINRAQAHESVIARLRVAVGRVLDLIEARSRNVHFPVAFQKGQTPARLLHRAQRESEPLTHFSKIFAWANRSFCAWGDHRAGDTAPVAE
jgi:hypothetical protein